MNKKVWLGTLVVFVLFVIFNFLVDGLVLGGTYMSLQQIWRPDMMSKMWIFYVVNVFIAFFVTLIFSKGYEKKGIMEGVRYGFYVGMLMSIPMGFDTYAMIAIPFSLALQWFIYGVIEYIIVGIALSYVFKEKPKEAPVQ